MVEPYSCGFGVVDRIHAYGALIEKSETCDQISDGYIKAFINHMYSIGHCVKSCDSALCGSQ